MRRATASVDTRAADTPQVQQDFPEWPGGENCRRWNRKSLRASFLTRAASQRATWSVDNFIRDADALAPDQTLQPIRSPNAAWPVCSFR